MKNGVTIIELIVILVLMCLLITGAVVGMLSFIHERTPPIAKNIIMADGYRVQIVKIDGCEYLKNPAWHVIIHKGNCSNPVHTQK